jgi:hypothetical protein
MPGAVLFLPSDAVREQIVITPHHPDSLRRPSRRLGVVEDDRFRQTLLWNVFRTLELLPPAFWLRRLERYFRSRYSLQLRSDSRADALSNVRGIGSVRWTDLAAILRDCEQADVLTNIERALARNAVTWLEQVGIG